MTDAVPGNVDACGCIQSPQVRSPGEFAVLLGDKDVVESCVRLSGGPRELCNCASAEVLQEYLQELLRARLVQLVVADAKDAYNHFKVDTRAAAGAQRFLAFAAASLRHVFGAMAFIEVDACREHDPRRSREVCARVLHSFERPLRPCSQTDDGRTQSRGLISAYFSIVWTHERELWMARCSSIISRETP